MGYARLGHWSKISTGLLLPPSATMVVRRQLIISIRVELFQAGATQCKFHCRYRGRAVQESRLTPFPPGPAQSSNDATNTTMKVMPLVVIGSLCVPFSSSVRVDEVYPGKLNSVVLALNSNYFMGQLAASLMRNIWAYSTLDTAKVLAPRSRCADCNPPPPYPPITISLGFLWRSHHSSW